jgi:hypothetical protein
MSNPEEGPGSPRTPDKPDSQGLGGDLFPGWSSLVIMLSIFGLLFVVAFFSVILGGSPHVASETGGVRAFGPEDFPEIRFDEPLLDAVTQAAASDQHGVFNVPPAPFSDDEIFPCSDCHEGEEVNYERRELEDFHEEIVLQHGPEDRWCFDCHNAEDRDQLRLANGALVGFDESYRLCGQCHGTIYRDWREGIHGRRRGFWNGAKSYLLCAHCHNPHAPEFAAMQPLPPPVRPQFLDAQEVVTP